MKLSCARGSETHVRGSAWKRLRKQMLIVRSRKGRGSRFIHDELVVAEAPRKQNQLTTHPRKLKLWSRKQRGRARGRQVGLEENYIGVFATAHMDLLTHRTIHPERVDPRMISMNNFRPLETPILMRLELHHKPGFVGFEPWGFGRISG